jgi:hypothetical protein
MLDVQKDEDFFACKWTVNEATGDNLLLAAGMNAALRVINVSNETLQWVGRCQRTYVSCNWNSEHAVLMAVMQTTIACCLADSAGPWRPHK